MLSFSQKMIFWWSFKWGYQVYFSANKQNISHFCWPTLLRWASCSLAIRLWVGGASAPLCTLPLHAEEPPSPRRWQLHSESRSLAVHQLYRHLSLFTWFLCIFSVWTKKRARASEICYGVSILSGLHLMRTLCFAHRRVGHSKHTQQRLWASHCC